MGSVLGPALPSLLSAAPQVLVPLVGLVVFLARRRRLPHAVRGLGLVACVLLTLAAVGRVGFTFWALTGGGRGTSPTSAAAVSLLATVTLSLVSALGLALLLAAALSGRMISPRVGASPWPGEYRPGPGPVAWGPAGPPPGSPTPGWSPPPMQAGPPPRG